MRWLLKRTCRQLREKLLAGGLTEKEARKYLDCQFRLRGNSGHLDFDEPKTFCDKLNWLKLYWHDPLVCKCADKVGVREYVAEKVGASFLVPLIGVYDSPEQVDFDALPGKFAMKVNWGSGQNVICPDKAKLDVEDARRKLSWWMRPASNHYYVGLEWGYCGLVPKILVEEFLEDADVIPDYKVYCFNGRPTLTAVIRGRGSDHFNAMFYTNAYEKRHLMMRGCTYSQEEYPKPPFWERMLEAAATLSAPFPHVRVDFYVPADGQLRVGEMTFWSANGLTPHEPPEWDRRLGDMLTLPPKAEYRNRAADVLAVRR